MKYFLNLSLWEFLTFIAAVDKTCSYLHDEAGAFFEGEAGPSKRWTSKTYPSHTSRNVCDDVDDSIKRFWGARLLSLTRLWATVSHTTDGVRHRQTIVRSSDRQVSPSDEKIQVFWTPSDAVRSSGRQVVRRRQTYGGGQCFVPRSGRIWQNSFSHYDSRSCPGPFFSINLV